MRDRGLLHPARYNVFLRTSRVSAAALPSPNELLIAGYTGHPNRAKGQTLPARYNSILSMHSKPVFLQ